MRLRKVAFPPTPPSTDPEGLQAAKYMAIAINQGLPGDYFARLMNTIDPAKVERAAGQTLHELCDWFREDQAARELLDQVPQFPQFCADLHREAQRLYPNARPTT